MNRIKILASFIAIFVGGTCLAQTGILDQNAEFRKLPPRKAVPAAQAPKPQPAQAANAQQPQTGTPKQQLGTPEGFVPSRKVYAPINSDNLNIDPVIDSINTSRSERPVSGSHRKGNNPEIFLIGDSTLRTEVDGNGSNGQWGWGYYLQNYFDSSRITVENHALGGESTRSYFKTWLFHTLRGVQPGDWVIVQIGHNDRSNGAEMNNGRFRGLLPGTGKEYKEVILPGNGTRERVYTYGEYLRIYVNEIRAKGANPLLLSLTQRNSFDKEGKAVPDGKTAMIKEIAEEMNVPFIDFNAAIRYKYDNVFDARKTRYLYFSDGIHSSSFGAVINAETFVEELRKRPDIALSQYLLPETHYESAVREGDKPVLFICGDSTGKIDNSEVSGQVGWGQVMQEYVNTKKITVDNHAKAGRSARTFLNEGRWNVVYDELRPGDYVLIQFGHNDGGPINVGKARGEFPGNNDDKEIMTIEASGINEGIYSYGWYLRKFCLDAMEKGATPIILSLTPTNFRDENGKNVRETKYKAWAKEVAEQMDVVFIDLNEISASKLDKMTKEEADTHFQNDWCHSSLLGAHRNAKSVAEGIRKSQSPLRKFMK